MTLMHITQLQRPLLHKVGATARIKPCQRRIPGKSRMFPLDLRRFPAALRMAPIVV